MVRQRSCLGYLAKCMSNYKGVIIGEQELRTGYLEPEGIKRQLNTIGDRISV